MHSIQNNDFNNIDTSIIPRQKYILPYSWVYRICSMLYWYLENGHTNKAHLEISFSSYTFHFFRCCLLVLSTIYVYKWRCGEHDRTWSKLKNNEFLFLRISFKLNLTFMNYGSRTSRKLPHKRRYTGLCICCCFSSFAVDPLSGNWVVIYQGVLYAAYACFGPCYCCFMNVCVCVFLFILVFVWWCLFHSEVDREMRNIYKKWQKKLVCLGWWERRGISKSSSSIWCCCFK